MACLRSISTGPWSAHSFNKDPSVADDDNDDRTNIQVLSRARTSGPDDQTLDRFEAQTQSIHPEMSLGQKNCCLLALLGSLHMTKHQYRLVLKLNFFQGPSVTIIAPNR